MFLTMSLTQSQDFLIYWITFIKIMHKSKANLKRQAKPKNLQLKIHKPITK